LSKTTRMTTAFVLFGAKAGALERDGACLGR
jgi:hypothetical protein